MWKGVGVPGRTTTPGSGKTFSARVDLASAARRSSRSGSSPLIVRPSTPRLRRYAQDERTASPQQRAEHERMESHPFVLSVARAAGGVEARPRYPCAEAAALPVSSVAAAPVLMRIA